MSDATLRTTGYSGKPLAQKLGLRPGFRVAVLHPPPDYDSLLAPLPDGIHFCRLQDAPLDCVHLFALDMATFLAEIGKARASLRPNGMIWVSWPKRSSGVQSDLTENLIRNHALQIGLVDVKVCAVSEIWSGLKLVIPVTLREL